MRALTKRGKVGLVIEIFAVLALPVFFDLDADQEIDRISWTAEESADAFLALDRDGNSLIDTGSELFGNATPLSSGERAENGFLALAELDRLEFGGNEDGLLTRDDEAYGAILLWWDYNRNAFSDPWELTTLEAEGVESIDLSYTETDLTDEHGPGYA